MIEETLLEAEEKMDKAVDFAAEEFAGIRTGRANTGMFAKILIDYYGAPTPLQQLASLTIPEARTVMISPYDKGSLRAISKALRDSDLGANPADDGQVIRLTLPLLTAERRKEYVKLARTKAEEGRIALRAVRRKAKEELERIMRDGEAGEDEVRRAEKDLDALTHEYSEKVDQLLARKEAELLEV